MDNLFELNSLTDLTFETTDSGGFYTSGQRGTAFTNRGNVLYFNWAVELVKGGEFDNCWMTVAVSMPRPAGQGS